MSSVNRVSTTYTNEPVRTSQVYTTAPQIIRTSMETKVINTTAPTQVIKTTAPVIYRNGPMPTGGQVATNSTKVTHHQPHTVQTVSTPVVHTVSTPVVHHHAPVVHTVSSPVVHHYTTPVHTTTSTTVVQKPASTKTVITSSPAKNYVNTDNHAHTETISFNKPVAHKTANVSSAPQNNDLSVSTLKIDDEERLKTHAEGLHGYGRGTTKTRYGVQKRTYNNRYNTDLRDPIIENKTTKNEYRNDSDCNMI
jgi:hypothetical protein